MSKVVHEGWMTRYGRKKIGRSYIHRRYFVLESRLLAYYKKKPQENMVPLKTILIDGSCRVVDKGLKTHQGHRVYVLCVYNKKERYQMTMAAFDIQDAHVWKLKIEFVIDQHQNEMTSGNKTYSSLDYNFGFDNGRSASSSDQDSQGSLEDEEERQRTLKRRTTIGKGPPDSVVDWTHELDSELSNQNDSDQVFLRKSWRLLQCLDGLRIFEELLEADYRPRGCSSAMKAVSIVEATCEEIFELVMSIDVTRFEWDCSYHSGSIVEEVDGHTSIVYQTLQLDWFPMLVWPRDLCYVRYWRRNDDGSYVVLFRSREHANCRPQPGYVRAHIESGGFTISPLESQNGRTRTKVQHLMQIDLKGWGIGYLPSFQKHCLMQMLNSVAGLREWFSQTDDRGIVRRMPVIVNKSSDSLNPKPEQKVPIDISDSNVSKKVPDEEPSDKLDLPFFSGNLRRDDRENSRDCWRISDGNNFRVRSKHFTYDKTKIRAGKHIMELVAVDWFKDVKRMDHVARRPGCAAQVASEKGLFSLVINIQVPASTHYSMVFYFVMKNLAVGSLLQRFVDGDDEFRNSRLKLIPSVPKGSWIVRQSVGSTPCLLGKAVDCTYIRGSTYLEIDVDIGSSTVANGVLGLVFGVITTLVVDMAFLVQANSDEELPEQLIGAVRVSHLDLNSAVVPHL